MRLRDYTRAGIRQDMNRRTHLRRDRRLSDLQISTLLCRPVITAKELEYIPRGQRHAERRTFIPWNQYGLGSGWYDHNAILNSLRRHAGRPSVVRFLADMLE